MEVGKVADAASQMAEVLMNASQGNIDLQRKIIKATAAMQLTAQQQQTAVQAINMAMTGKGTNVNTVV